MKVYGLGVCEDAMRMKADASIDEQTAWAVMISDGRSPVHAPSWKPSWPEFSGEMVSWHSVGEMPHQALDFTSVTVSGFMLAVKNSALELTDSLWNLVEKLPLRCSDYDYSAIHIKRHHDIFNVEASTITSPNSERNIRHGTMGPVVLYDFDAGGLDEVDLFRVPELDIALCTEGFVKRLRDAGVTGWVANQVCPPTEKQIAKEAELLWRRDDGVLASDIGFGDQALRAWNQPEREQDAELLNATGYRVRIRADLKSAEEGGLNRPFVAGHRSVYYRFAGLETDAPTHGFYGIVESVSEGGEPGGHVVAVVRFDSDLVEAYATTGAAVALLHNEVLGTGVISEILPRLPAADNEFS